MKKTYTSASIKSKIYKKLSQLAREENHTISEQLEFLLITYVNRSIRK